MLCAPIRARSRTCDWSPRKAPSPIDTPAATTACAAIVTPSPTTVDSAAPSCAVDVLASTTPLPMIAASWIRTPPPNCTPPWITTFAPISMWCGSTTSSSSTSPGARSDGRSTSAPLERLLQTLKYAHDAQATAAVRDRRDPLADAFGEVSALDPQRLLVRDARAPHVAGAGDVLAVRAVRLVEALVVDDQFLLELHVVESGHLVRADDREAPLLVRVEPRQVQVCHEPGWEAQVGENHVLDRPVHVALAERVHLVGLLVGQVQQHRHVVRAQRPERVLV